MGRYSFALISIIICLAWLSIFIIDLRSGYNQRLADYNQSDTGVVRIYDIDGDVIDEYSGNLIIDKQDKSIVMIEVDGDKIITFDEDGDVEVTKK